MIKDTLFKEFFQKDSLYLRCVRPLLKMLDYDKSDHFLIENLPYMHEYLNLNALLKIMRLLGFEIKTFKIRLKDVNASYGASLFVDSSEDQVFILENKKDDSWRIFDSSESEYKDLSIEKNHHLEEIRGRVYFFKKKDEEDTFNSVASLKISWLKTVLSKFRPLFMQVFFLSFILNTLALSIPFFVMTVYPEYFITSEHPVHLCQNVDNLSTEFNK